MQGFDDPHWINDSSFCSEADSCEPTQFEGVDVFPVDSAH